MRPLAFTRRYGHNDPIAPLLRDKGHEGTGLVLEKLSTASSLPSSAQSTWFYSTLSWLYLIPLDYKPTLCILVDLLW